MEEFRAENWKITTELNSHEFLIINDDCMIIVVVNLG